VSPRNHPCIRWRPLLGTRWPIVKYSDYTALQCGCEVPAAEFLHLSAVGAAQLAHATDGSFGAEMGGDAACSQITEDSMVVLLTNSNKAIVDCRLRRQCTIHDEYLFLSKI